MPCPESVSCQLPSPDLPPGSATVYCFSGSPASDTWHVLRAALSRVEFWLASASSNYIPEAAPDPDGIRSGALVCPDDCTSGVPAQLAKAAESPLASVKLPAFSLWLLTSFVFPIC